MLPPQYLVVKVFIESGRITEFRQIFEYISVNAIANHLSISHKRMKELKEDQSNLFIGEALKIAELFDLRPLFMFDIISKQIKKDGILGY